LRPYFPGGSLNAVLAPIKFKQVDIDLVEIQELDSKKVLEFKLKQAFRHHKGPFFVDDSSLFLSCLKYRLPGPLIKWFNITIESKGIYEICKKMKDFKARAVTYVAYAESPNKVKIFTGRMEGKIVKPKGQYNFGYDPIFVPYGKSEALSEMKSAGNFLESPRGIAIKKLKKYLLKYEK
jgi:non-canonical purine NTP pyrophosphatase (RdgB/HAM1 family)